ncbi:MAG: hypothetical protein MHMPM18_004783 [Marteilia pararefringens]
MEKSHIDFLNSITSLNSFWPIIVLGIYLLICYTNNIVRDKLNEYFGLKHPKETAVTIIAVIQTSQDLCSVFYINSLKHLNRFQRNGLSIMGSIIIVNNFIMILLQFEMIVENRGHKLQNNNIRLSFPRLNHYMDKLKRFCLLQKFSMR